MPELPEVETVRRGLASSLTGAVITAVEVNLLKQVRRPRGDARAFAEGLTGRRILAIDRRGKYLIFSFAEGCWLLAHLGMSGRLLVKDGSAEVAPHTHIVLRFDKGLALHYQDVRQFGGMAFWTTDPFQAAPLVHLGPEPFSAAFSAAWLYKKSRGRKIAVKSFILNQRILAGVGNIYADEALFRAGIRPRKAAGRLSRADCTRLQKAIQAVLEEGIAAGGSSIRDYVAADGHTGSFQMAHAVYGRKGAPCPHCGQLLKGVLVGGRSSVYCPHCQSS
ncbi:MAG: bifunctional DNA-formamidopyrimidine glycosylase/DNA-(apurinic or apyrimidinic site) lyase [Clostridiales bacterium]|nr:bifunctional DNA-formamidopyrimidine glycosylase/DNA-(apurinic or apyrimidinic site) lyase [Clostridiales bacterium]